MNVVSISDHQQKAWDAYIAARSLADETRSMSDGIVAARAWRRWLDLFMTTEQREILDRRASA